MKCFLKDLPDYNYIYLGDNARAPYGSKSQDVIFEYAKEAVDFLFSKDCKLIIFACHTASAQALRKIQQEYLPIKYPDKKVLGVVRPLVEEVAQTEAIKRVGVLGTRATINSGVYEKELAKINPQIEVFSASAPLLAPLIEEGWQKKPETKMILKKYLRPLKEKNIQALILACTHYPFLLKETRQIMGKNCQVYNPGEVISKKLKEYLGRHDSLISSNKKNPYLGFYTSDNIRRFRQLGEKFLERKINQIEKVDF